MTLYLATAFMAGVLVGIGGTVYTLAKQQVDRERTGIH